MAANKLTFLERDFDYVVSAKREVPVTKVGTYR